ncbi:conjugative transposon protein TraM [Pedobacter frigiditerrae]|uniref:Conjugative transposon protein TraM n=1 Tax=Pedobacter frigiditerrae TaxID=2530452 RepID=A0A4R0MXD0_9SPHI|nr:conjugative transposon protein TraM [Pedobacter frigiditerrae]TCC91928.1 conjugative transposon protein TraM [Pedobacter frigiditerrae]
METKQKDKRKVLLMLPLLVLPFMALAFYAMGGGKANQLSGHLDSKGINTSLPDASFKTEDPKDKMGIYNLTAKDSNANENGIKNVVDRLGFNAKEDIQTEQINQKLEALNKEITKPTPRPNTSSTSVRQQPNGMKNDVDRLEMLMNSMQSGKGSDPEMEQMNSMLQSIMDIQHPERVRQKYINQVADSPDSLFKAIPAVIVDNQKVLQGATIKLRLLDSVTLNGQVIPKGQFIYGICNIANQRLLLDIKTIRLGNRIVPVDLSVYSLDGIRGIEAPEALLTDAINGGSDDAVRNIQLMGLDQSMGAQIAGAGIEATKNLFSKKVKRIKVKLKAKYPVLLRNNKPNQSIR